MRVLARRWKHFSLFVVLAVVTVWLLRSSLDPRRTFDVVTVNREGEVLDQVKTRFEGYSFNVGILEPRANGFAEKTYGHHIGKWPETLEVTWIVVDHPEHVFERQLAVPKPLHLRGSEQLDLVVEFKGEAVTVYPRAVDISHGLHYRFKD